MKTVTELAREAGLHIYPEYSAAFQRFHDLAIAAEHKRLLEGSGEPFTYLMSGEPVYTYDEIAAAVLKEKERCAVICDEHEQYPSLTPRHCAAAIRGQ